jgi:hypothetical protein
MAMDPFQLPKHQKYKNSYRPFDYYWGLGVEHETYLKTSQTKDFTALEGNMKAERYSVDYLKIYRPEPFRLALAAVLAASGGKLTVPVLMNSHSFTHCDVFNSHRTTYEKIPKPNPQYTGKSLWDWICEKSPWLRDNYDRTFVWDGDTVEIMTVHFYKATVSGVMTELRSTAAGLEAEFARLPKQGILAAYGPLRLAAPRNEPFAVHLTNLKNVAMFNNGTLHINLTLPTRLGWSGLQPLFWSKFRRQHQRLARLVQWLEPALIAVYGSGDPLSAVSDRFPAGSQRLSVSRYIGLGVYDTETMAPGKILQIARSAAGPLPWYDWLHERCDYYKLENIGLDLNFNKHGAAGLELRFFDQMPYESLEKVLKGLVLVMDAALRIKQVEKPQDYKEWISAAGQALLLGRGWSISVEQQRCILSAFRITELDDPKEPVNVVDWLRGFFVALEKYKGKCWSRMMAA